MEENGRFRQACRMLGLAEDENLWTEADLRKQYRRYALLYHPDKNHKENATAKFREIRDCYEYLMKYQGYMEMEDGDDDRNWSDESSEDPTTSTYARYENALFAFLRPILQNELFCDIGTRIIHKLIQYISASCEEKAIGLLRRIDKSVCYKIYELLKTYQDIFHCSSDFLDKVEQVYKSSIQGDECIRLTPFLDDLLENNLYRLTKDDQTYIIPLWHYELVYDHLGSDLYIQCIPSLPKHITLDEKNNLHVCVYYSLQELWSNAEHKVWIGDGGQSITLLRDQLRMTAKQVIVFTGRGIARINPVSVYDVSKKSDVYIHVFIRE